MPPTQESCALFEGRPREIRDIGELGVAEARPLAKACPRELCRLAELGVVKSSLREKIQIAEVHRPKEARIDETDVVFEARTRRKPRAGWGVEIDVLFEPGLVEPGRCLEGGVKGLFGAKDRLAEVGQPGESRPVEMRSFVEDGAAKRCLSVEGRGIELGGVEVGPGETGVLGKMGAREIGTTGEPRGGECRLLSKLGPSEVRQAGKGRASNCHRPLELCPASANRGFHLE